MKTLRFRAVIDGQLPFEDDEGQECRCRELDGFEADMDDSIWQTRTPPLHDGCRCVLEVVVVIAATEPIGHRTIALGFKEPAR